MNSSEPADHPEGAESKKATFEGRLKLQDFMHIPQPSTSSSTPTPSPSPIRRSPRFVPSQNTLSTSAIPSPTPSSPLKRKPSSPSPSSSTTTTPSTPPAKRRPKGPTSYAPPSKYAHLPLLPDGLGPNLLILFVGLNPGIRTSTTGHSYAHPSNLFWKLLHTARITPDRIVPWSEDRTLPARYALGLTNIVARPTRNGAELKPAELDAGLDALEEKVRRWRPEVVCLVGKGIWDSVERVRSSAGGRKRPRGGGKGPFEYGWRDEGENMGVVVGRDSGDGDGDGDGDGGGDGGGGWSGARVFVATSTSGLAATLSPAEKEAVWKQLGDWCVQRRAERAVVVGEEMKVETEASEAS